VLHSAVRAEVLMMLALRAFHSYLAGEELGKMQLSNPKTYVFRLPGDNTPAVQALWVGTVRLNEVD
jgi:hypothetical protein